MGAPEITNTVRLAGCDPFASRGKFSRRVGVLFPESDLRLRQSALANLRFHGRLRHLPRSQAADVLAQVRLTDHTGVQVEKLSSGLARRLAFGRATLLTPRVLLLAEPFADCDDASISLLTGLLPQLAGEGVTVLIAAQDSTHFVTLCDTICQLEQGRIVSAYEPGAEQRSTLPFMIPARLDGSVALANLIDILYVEARDNRTILHTAQDRLATQFALTELEQRLSRSGFFRAHRSYLVNLQHVKEVVAHTGNSCTLLLKDPVGAQISLSRSAERGLRQLLGY